MKLRALWYALGGMVWAAVPLLAAAQGLVSGPCGNISTAAQACNLCTFTVLIQNILNFTIGLSIPLAAILFAYAGWLYFSNRENPGQVEKAHKIFTSVFIGFCIAVAGYLIVQTVLTTLSPQHNWLKGFTAADCMGNRNTTAQLGDLLNRNGIGATPTPTSIAVSPGGSAYSCESGTVAPDGYCYKDGQLTGAPTLQSNPAGTGLTCTEGGALAGGHCYSVEGFDLGEAVPAEPSQVGTGDCSPGTLAEDFGEDASSMSCIARAESTCNPVVPGDKLGAMPGYFASIGIYQINMSNHQVQCDDYNGGVPVNCPQAFSGPYTGRTKNTVTVVNPTLYQQCKSMLSDPNCNSQVAQGILDKEGFQAWSTHSQCGV